MLRWLALGLLCVASSAGAVTGLDGSAIQRMCQGADKVRALSVMCHNYLNGFMDAAMHYNPRPGFCVPEGGKEAIPNGLVEWLKTHPEAQKQPAGQAVDRALKDLYPCKGKK